MTHTNQNSGLDNEIGSPRSFGFVFAIVFAFISLYPLLGDGNLRPWALLVSAAFLLLAIFAPNLLQPLNILWCRFGLLLSKIVNPVVMAVIYAVAIVPFGIGARLAKKDLLRLKFDPEMKSYWVDRTPPGPDPKSLEDQF